MVWIYVALVAFVLAWVFDLAGTRDWVPGWLPFVIALGLELRLFLGTRRAVSGEEIAEQRLPQEIDRGRYGYLEDDVEDRPQRAFRRFVLALVVIAALGGVVWFAGSRGWDGLDGETRAEAAALFSEEASRIVGRPVVIRCDEAGAFVGAVQDADGVAEIGGRLAYLTPERCYDLYRLAYDDDVVFSQTARAIAVLAHEAWHLRGVRDEGVTECYALQSGVELGRRLGLKDETARQLMRQQLVENQLRARGSVVYLVPAECRDGGRLDLDPASSAFP